VSPAGPRGLSPRPEECPPGLRVAGEVSEGSVVQLPLGEERTEVPPVGTRSHGLGMVRTNPLPPRCLRGGVLLPREFHHDEAAEV